MGAVLHLLTSESFRRYTRNYVASDRFADVCRWLDGFEYALVDAFPQQYRAPSISGGPCDPGLDGIHEWLIVRRKKQDMQRSPDEGCKSIGHGLRLNKLSG